MTEPQITPKDRRPRMYPAPEFPPRKPALFARTPPAVFPVLLGLLGLGLALRRGLEGTVLAGLAEALMGGLLVVWAFAVLAMAAKIARRPGVLAEDLRVLPGRAGMAAATMSVMAAAGVVLPYAPGAAVALAFAGLVLQGVLALVLVAVLARMPAEAREVNPAWHLQFVGFVVAAVPLAQAGWAGLAGGIFWATLVPAGLIWGVSLAQLIRRVPPAPLRPLLAVHLAPAALFATVAALTGQGALAAGFAVAGLVLLAVLAAAGRWIAESGFSALWGAFTFPLAALAGGLLATGGLFRLPGLAVMVLAALVVPAIAWRVLKLWPGGRLAAKTNAAEA